MIWQRTFLPTTVNASYCDAGDARPRAHSPCIQHLFIVSQGKMLPNRIHGSGRLGAKQRGTIFITPVKKCCLTQKGSRSVLSNHQEAVTKGACSLTHGVTTQQTPLILSCLIPFTFSHITWLLRTLTPTLFSKLNKAVLFKPRIQHLKSYSYAQQKITINSFLCRNASLVGLESPSWQEPPWAP